MKSTDFVKNQCFFYRLPAANKLGLMHIRDAIIIAFIVNELLVIVENAGLMGVPIPEVMENAIELLKAKNESI